MAFVATAFTVFDGTQLRLAALVRQQHLTLATFDTDFDVFPELARYRPAA